MTAPAAPTLPTGPAIGDLFPDFTLPDQWGAPITLSAARAGRPAMIVVHRSAAW